MSLRGDFWTEGLIAHGGYVLRVRDEEGGGLRSRGDGGRIGVVRPAAVVVAVNGGSLAFGGTGSAELGEVRLSTRECEEVE